MSVLVVCTANVCRSPLAARLLSALLQPLEVPVTSAGARAVPGLPACPTATATTSLVADHANRGDLANLRAAVPLHREPAPLLRGDHANRSDHASVLLEPAHVRSASLILGAAREHRSAALALVPNAQRKTFTLLQAARLATWLADQGVTAPPDLAGEERLAWWVDELDAVRGDAPRGLPEDDDLPDPHEGGVRHDAVLPQLVEAVERLTTVIG